MASEPKPQALLKDILGPTALSVIADAGVAASATFDRSAFLDAASAGLDALSLMERVRHIAEALAKALPPDYPAALAVVRGMAPHLTHGFQAVALAEFVARHGLEDFDASLAALATLTRFGTAEFAVRPFLAAEPGRTLAAMTDWAQSEDEHLRRLASEGSRPRLPWATRLPALRSDPTLAAPILEALRADPSLYVRKSVANHLNDIGKERPAWLVERLGTWPRENARTQWIIRHALRTLIKQGDPGALALIGASHGASVDLRSFSVTPGTVHLGEAIAIRAELVSTAKQIQRLVVDYRLHYARATGKTAVKVFKWKTFDLEPGETAHLGIRQTIKDFSTRRHHSGTHLVELLVNGRTEAAAEFALAVPGA